MVPLKVSGWSAHFSSIRDRVWNAHAMLSVSVVNQSAAVEQLGLAISHQFAYLGHRGGLKSLHNTHKKEKGAHNTFKHSIRIALGMYGILYCFVILRYLWTLSWIKMVEICGFMA